MLVNAVFETDPGEESQGNGKVEEAFVGDGKDDEHGAKGEEDHGQAVEVMVARSKGVEEGYN